MGAFEQQLQCVSIVLVVIDDEDTGDISHEHLKFSTNRFRRERADKDD
jgi:hypothetical protein